jgi:hypothetical protein
VNNLLSYPEFRCVIDFGAGLKSTRAQPAFFIRAKSRSAAARIFRDRFPRETRNRRVLIIPHSDPLA